MDKKAEIKKLLPGSRLIEESPYTIEQWQSILMVLPEKYIDELYGFLLLESGKKDQS